MRNVIIIIRSQYYWTDSTINKKDNNKLNGNSIDRLYQCVDNIKLNSNSIRMTMIMSIMMMAVIMTVIKSRSVSKIYRKIVLNIGSISIGSCRLYSKMINIIIITTTIIDISS